MIWWRSWARAVRSVSVSAGRRVHSPRSATSRSCWAMAAIVDGDRVLSGVVECRCHTGNSRHRPPTVPGPGMRGDSGQLWRSIPESFLGPSAVVVSDTRSLALAARAAREAEPPPCATPGEANLSPRFTSSSLRFSTPDDLLPAREWSRHSLAGARCSTTREPGLLVQRPGLTRERTDTPRRTSLSLRPCTTHGPEASAESSRHSLARRSLLDHRG